MLMALSGLPDEFARPPPMVCTQAHTRTCGRACILAHGEGAADGGSLGASGDADLVQMWQAAPGLCAWTVLRPFPVF